MAKSTGFLPSGLAFALFCLTAQRESVFFCYVLGGGSDQFSVNRHAKVPLLGYYWRSKLPLSMFVSIDISMIGNSGGGGHTA